MGDPATDAKSKTCPKVVKAAASSRPGMPEFTAGPVGATEEGDKSAMVSRKERGRAAGSGQALADVQLALE